MNIMEDWIENILNAIGIRHSGPLSIRLIIQPIMSLAYAVISGIKDAKAGRVPFLIDGLILGKENRKVALTELWKNVGKLFIMAVIMEVIFEIIEFKTVHPFEVIRVSFFLSILPYIIFRGVAERIISLFIKKK